MKSILILIFIGSCILPAYQSVLVSRETYVPCSAKYAESMKGLCMTSANDCLGATLVDLCPNKNSICCVNDSNIPAWFEPSKLVSLDDYLKIFADTARSRAFYTAFVKSMTDASVSLCHEAAAFIAQIQGETGNFQYLEESSQYASKYDFDGKLGNNVADDGSKYRGRGFLYLRGKINYMAIAPSLKQIFGYDIYNEPERAALPSVAFQIASWIWSTNSYVVTQNGHATKGNLKQLADGTFHNFTLLTHSLTTNLNDLKVRALAYENAVDVLQCKKIKRGRGVACEIDANNAGYTVPVCLLDFKKPYCGCEGQFDIESCPYGYNSNNQCRSPSLIKCCIEKCNAFLDLVVLMDSSLSIGYRNFQKAKDFVKMLINSVNIGENSTRVAIINFGDNANDVVNRLDSKLNKSELLRKVDKIAYLAQNTNTQSALMKANDVILRTDAGMRPIDQGVPKVLVVITDGKSNVDEEKTIPNAQKIKRRDISIVAVGVGTRVDNVELHGIASNADDVYNVDSYGKISEIIESIAKTTCEKPALVPLEEPVVAVVKKFSYRYFKFNLYQYPNGSINMLFSVGLVSLKGNVELFFSFDVENPKDRKDYIAYSEATDISPHGYLVEYIKRQTSIAFDSNEKVYQINSQKTNKNVLFMSVKGYADDNQFRLHVYNRTLSNSGHGTKRLELNASRLFFILALIGFTHVSFSI